MKLDGERFAQMVLQGAENLSRNAEMVDALNVFPVPDGDTGTNMNLSMTSGAKEVRNNPAEHIGKVAGHLARGLLMGARGNSGVILSQLFRGFSKAMENKEMVNSTEFAKAFEAGVETAYKAVMKPVEGTILTVAKDAAKKAVQTAKKQQDITAVMEETLKEAKASLERTPDLLPVLKEVGVVDSGGQGLVVIYEGFNAVLKGESLPETSISAPSMNELVNAEHHKSVHSHMSTEDIEFGYCTEFMVRLEDDKLKDNPFSEEEFRNEISNYGDSLLVVSSDDIVKVHIHAEQPGDVLSFGQKYGSLVNMKIENMRQQHTDLIEKDRKAGGPEVDPAPARKEKFGIITVAMGDGISEMFKSLGATVVIEGGQTMNPSTEDILKAVEDANAEEIIILPNNKNIIMAAEQAASVVEGNVEVVKTKTVPQGMSALLAFNPAQTLEENAEAMSESAAAVKTGQVTFAVRDTSIEGFEIKKDDFMGIADGKIVAADKDMNEATKLLLDKLINEDDEIITVIVGKDAAKEDVEKLTQHIEDKFDQIEIEVHEGGQPLYTYIFSVE